jgi:hypothetical protein
VMPIDDFGTESGRHDDAAEDSDEADDETEGDAAEAELSARPDRTPA